MWQWLRIWHLPLKLHNHTTTTSVVHNHQSLLASSIDIRIHTRQFLHVSSIGIYSPLNNASMRPWLQPPQCRCGAAWSYVRSNTMSFVLGETHKQLPTPPGNGWDCDTCHSSLTIIQPATTLFRITNHYSRHQSTSIYILVNSYTCHRSAYTRHLTMPFPNR